MLKRVKFLPEMFRGTNLVISLDNKILELPWDMKELLSNDIKRVVMRLQQEVIWEHFYECDFSRHSEKALLNKGYHFVSDAAFLDSDGVISPVIVKLVIPYYSDSDIFSALTSSAAALNLKLSFGDMSTYDEVFNAVEKDYTISE